MEINKLNMINVDKFWNWFSQNCQDFGDNYDNNNLLNELDAWVTQLGNFTWEIGPGKTKGNALVISPNGNLELLQKTKEIIAKAKGCDDWEYYYAKPPKQWNLVFEFEANNEEMIEINASEWSYVLLKYEDEMYTIIIKSPQLRKLDNNDKLTAAEIVLDGILGEEVRMQIICEIEIVEEFEKSHQNKASNISDLSKHFNTLIE